MDHSQINISITFNDDLQIKEDKINKKTELALNIKKQSFKIQPYVFGKSLN